MSVKAKFKYVRMSPQKVRSVMDLVRGKKVQNAIEILNYSSRRAAMVINKAIKSAVANANVKGGVDIDNLYVSSIHVGPGPTLKRWRAKARGMAGKVGRRTSHITIELDEA